VNAGSRPTALPWLLLLGIFPIQFLCFYWWPARDYYFSGDALYYFSRQIDSLPELAARFFSVDELYQYRPLTYVFFTFVLLPVFGNNPHPYHLVAYLFSTVNILLACACVYYWVGKNAQLALFASIFLILNPVNFFPSFGPTYIDQWLSSFFYFLTLLLVFRDSPKAGLLAPIAFLLVLLSKEHGVILPAHALLVLLVLGTPLRDAFRKTRNLWILLAVFVVFQLVIRHGVVFAPETSNPNLQFDFSVTRIAELLKGAKALIFYPENYLLGETLGVGRAIRLAILIPLIAAVVIAVKRQPRLALSGILWLGLSLLPVAFLRQTPFPRHYYIGMPGFAILLACAFPSWRSILAATPVFALLTITNVHLYVRESWVAVGARLTRMYIGDIDSMAGETGRSSFYVLNSGDPHFFWHVDGGAALPHVLGREATFRFAALKEPLETEAWLNNGVNVVVANGGDIMDAVKTGEFPPEADRDVCALVYRFARTDDGCAVLFRGQPFDVESAGIETPSQLPVFETQDGVVTLPRTTIRVAADAGFQLQQTARLLANAAASLRVEIYGHRESRFTKAFSQELLPGERRELSYVVPRGVFDHIFIRVQPGPNSNELKDWLLWERGTNTGQMD
jgi:hypothetical protein